MKYIVLFLMLTLSVHAQDKPLPKIDKDYIKPLSRDFVLPKIVIFVSPDRLTIVTDKGDVRISRIDGSVEADKGVNMNEAARILWDEISNYAKQNENSRVSK